MLRLTSVLLLGLVACQRREAATLPVHDCDCQTSLDGFVAHEACLERAAGAYHMRPSVLRSLPLQADAPFEARSKCGMFWVRADGRALPTVTFDNGADYFCSGLTRYLQNGKYGYMNAKLEVVVPASFDFAFPFRGALAAVCRQCTFTSDGEHGSVSCAHCGAIDVQGRWRVPLDFSTEQIFARLPSTSEDDCRTGDRPEISR